VHTFGVPNSGDAITSAATGDALARRKVLVVDDDDDVRSCLVEFLSRAGIAAGGALDGQDALEQVQSGPPPCLIVLDLEMPRLTGPELIAALRTDSRCAAIPLVSMTAGPSPVDLPTCGHIAKPFAFAQLLEIVFSECRRCALCDGDGPVVGSIYDARLLADRAVR
jgi:CheY-like chemotaxis protein